MTISILSLATPRFVLNARKTKFLATLDLQMDVTTLKESQSTYY
jgi:hypothetical protein